MTHSPGGEFQAGGKPAPPWLAKLARAVSGIPRVLDTEDEAALLSNVFEQTAASASDTVYSPYDTFGSIFSRRKSSETNHAQNRVQQCL